MTAPTPSPETPADIRALIEAERDALLAPLRAENALLRAEASAHMGVARAAEAEAGVARLRRILIDVQPLIRHDARCLVMSPTFATECDCGARAPMTAARALAEGQT